VTEHTAAGVVFELTWTKSLAEAAARENHSIDDSPR
jgi:hypothetical protein